MGVNNLATVTSNVFQPFIINGRPIKSINQYYNKCQKKKQQLLPANQYTSKKIQQLGYKREMKLNDYLHKSAAILVNYLVSQTIDVLVIGTNKGWKQNINIGSRNNQNFVGIPFYKFKQILTYLCEENGIEVHEQEESYTSKASFLNGDFIPTFTPGQNKIPKVNLKDFHFVSTIEDDEIERAVQVHIYNKLMNENFDLVNEPSYVLQQLIGTKLKVDKEFSGD